MKQLFLFLGLALCTLVAPAQVQDLSQKATISILTVDPGTSLNDAFGHSAFRVRDTTGLDLVFDYGRYPFNDPNFYLNFARGKLTYSMGGSYYPDFYTSYSQANRGILEQVLNLTQKEKQALYQYLLNNYKPKNREYQYDFFYDNCATKIKDVLLVNCSKPVTFHLPKAYREATFRELIQQNLEWNSWGSLGIDIALGSIIDKPAPAEDHMFLPANIARFFEAATMGNNKPLVKNSHRLYKKEASVKTPKSFLNPFLSLGLLSLIILVVTYRDYKTKQRSRWLDGILFGLTGCIGVFLLLLWFATDHTATGYNYNLLWAVPLNLIAWFPLLKTTVKPWVRNYLKLLVILLCLLVFHWISGVQGFAPALSPLLIALACRYVFLIQKLKQIET